MPDYTALAAKAATLVQNSGRQITLVQYDDTLEDSNKPWRGPVNARTSPKSTLQVYGVFVEPSSATKLGMSTEVSDLLKRSKQVIIIASTADLSIYNEVLDSDNSRWKIVGMEKLKPASTTLLYFMGVAQ